MILKNYNLDSLLHKRLTKKEIIVLVNEALDTNFIVNDIIESTPFENCDNSFILELSLNKVLEIYYINTNELDKLYITEVEIYGV